MKKISIIMSIICLLFLMISCDNSEDENNPVPVLSSLSPASAVANMPAFTLTLNGSNFVQGATVSFGGAAKTATFVSSTQLQCTINPADIPSQALQNEPGAGESSLQDSTITVTVTNPSPGGGNSNAVNFSVTNNYSFTTPSNISNDNYSSNRTKIGLDSQNNINVIWDSEQTNGSINIIYTRSTDHGATWTPQVCVSDPNMVSWIPDMAIGTPGDINVVWQEDTGGVDDIFFGRSADTGTTWSMPYNISKSRYNSTSPAIAVDTTGNLNVVWNDIVNVGMVAVFLKDFIFFARSTNSGIYFSTPFNLADPGCKCYPAIAVDPAGRIFVAYRTGQCHSSGAIVVTISGDGGFSWSAVKMVSVSGEDTNYPAFVVDSSGYINLAWQQAVNGFWDIYFSRSTDIGVTWSAPVNISQTAGSSQHPSITVDSQKNLNVSWDEDVAGVEEIYHSRSVNDGVNWSSTVNISNNAGESTWPDVTVDNSCNLYFAWLDRTTGTIETYFLRSVIAALAGR